MKGWNPITWFACRTYDNSAEKYALSLPQVSNFRNYINQKRSEGRIITKLLIKATYPVFLIRTQLRIHPQNNAKMKQGTLGLKHSPDLKWRLPVSEMPYLHTRLISFPPPPTHKWWKQVSAGKGDVGTQTEGVQTGPGLRRGSDMYLVEHEALFLHKQFIFNSLLSCISFIVNFERL